ncbi:hypothetical protein [Moraxella lacunata]|uniref:hypothetical protein n=1 Tax=Moraxella lacunata TaxID=477 RepID=UPI003EE395B6
MTKISFYDVLCYNFSRLTTPPISTMCRLRICKNHETSISYLIIHPRFIRLHPHPTVHHLPKNGRANHGNKLPHRL